MPSPGKYVIKKKYPIADSPASSIAKRSDTLNRSFTINDNKVHFQKPQLNFVISKPNNEPPTKTVTTRMKLTKAVSKKTSSLHTAMYDENFIRYVRELDSYFVASEARTQSSENARGNKSNKTLAASRTRVRYATEVNTSMEASSGSLSDARSYSLDSPKSQKKRSIPRVSVVYDTAPHIDLLDSPKSFSETASSYYATPDQDRSFITTPSDNYSFFATASEQSSYLTANHDTLDESHTFVQDIKQFSSSQETLYNDDDDLLEDDDDDLAREDDEDEDEEEMRDLVGDLAIPSSSLNSTSIAFSRLKLGCHKYDHLEDETTDRPVAYVSTSRDGKMEAKVRRSNFVRTTCIDLEEDENIRHDAHPPMDNSSPTLVKNEEKAEASKDSHTKCSPV